jgi:hypothetical protein
MCSGLSNAESFPELVEGTTFLGVLFSAVTGLRAGRGLCRQENHGRSGKNTAEQRDRWTQVNLLSASPTHLNCLKCNIWSGAGHQNRFGGSLQALGRELEPSFANTVTAFSPRRPPTHPSKQAKFFWALSLTRRDWPPTLEALLLVGEDADSSWPVPSSLSDSPEADY